eukprot:Skav214861  [mRNA]  locus=scaffold16:523215:524075:- [translate_table: standard]
MIRVIKVKAHQDVTTLSDGYTHWAAVMNDRADVLAKKQISAYCSGHIRNLKRFCLDRSQSISHLQQFFKMWGSMNECAMNAIKTKRVQRTGEMPSFQLLVDVEQLQPLQCNVSDAAVSSCLYGATFISRVIQYFDQLEWDFTQKAVSLLELYIDFTLCTGTLAPVLLTRQSLGLTAGPKVYMLKDQNIVADLSYNDLRDQSRVWQRTIKWLLKNWVNCPWAQLSKTSSLAKYGYAVDQNGLTGQPRFRSSTAVCSQLWAFFHASGGVRRTLGRKWAVSTTAMAGGA